MVELQRTYLGPQFEQQRLLVDVVHGWLQSALATLDQSPAAESSTITEGEIDLTTADEYGDSEQDILRKRLKQLGLWDKGYGYSAFKPELIPLLRETGTYYRPGNRNSNRMWCCHIEKDPHTGKLILDHDGNTNLVDYIISQGDRFKGHGVFVVYDLSHLSRVDFDESLFEFNDPTQRLAAIRGLISVKIN